MTGEPGNGAYLYLSGFLPTSVEYGNVNYFFGGHKSDSWSLSAETCSSCWCVTVMQMCEFHSAGVVSKKASVSLQCTSPPPAICMARHIWSLTRHSDSRVKQRFVAQVSHASPSIVWLVSLLLVSRWLTLRRNWSSIGSSGPACLKPSVRRTGSLQGTPVMTSVGMVTPRAGTNAATNTKTNKKNFFNPPN